MSKALHQEKSKVQVYATMMILSLASLLAFGYFERSYLLWIAMSLLVIALFIYPLAVWIHWAWMQLAEVLAWINTRLLLGIIFFLILVPLAFLRKRFSKHNMPLEPDDSSSYFINSEDRTINFEQPW